MYEIVFQVSQQNLHEITICVLRTEKFSDLQTTIHTNILFISYASQTTKSKDKQTHVSQLRLRENVYGNNFQYIIKKIYGIKTKYSMDLPTHTSRKEKILHNKHFFQRKKNLWIF